MRPGTAGPGERVAAARTVATKPSESPADVSAMGGDGLGELGKGLDLEAELLLHPLPRRPAATERRTEPHVVECLADGLGKLRMVAGHHLDAGRVDPPG